MRINRFVLLGAAAAMIFQCSACKSNDNDMKSDITAGNVGAAGDTARRELDTSSAAGVSGGIAAIEPEAAYYYYTAQHSVKLEKNESLFDNEWCLGLNGLYYSVYTDMGDEGHATKLGFISYDDIRKLDDINDLFVGSSEKKDDNMREYEYDISSSQIMSSDELNGAKYSKPCAYKNGAMVLASVEQEDGTHLFKAVYIDENMEFNIISDITDMVNQTDAVIADEDPSWYMNKFYGFESEDGTIYCMGSDSGKKTVLCFFDDDGKLLDKVVLDYSAGNIVYGGNGNVSWLYKTSDAQTLAKYNVYEGADKLVNIPLDSAVGSARIYGCKNENVLWTQNSAYDFDMEDNAILRVLDWNTAGVRNGMFDTVCIAEDGTVFGASLTGDGISISGMYKSDIAINSEKVVLKLAVYNGMSDSYDSIVRFFNASNSRYQVELEEYADSSQFVTSMSSKNGPDIISTEMIDLAQFAANGYLTDIYELMDRNDSKVKAEDLLVSVMDANTYDGKLMAIPVTFNPYVLVGGDGLRNIENWNIDEFIRLIEKNDRIMTNYIYTTDNYVTDLALIYWEGEKDRLLDWENGQAHFDSDEFVRFLEALENYNPPVQMSNIAESVYWQKDEIYLHETLIFPYSTQEIRAIIGTQNPVYIGYPTGDKTTFGVISSTSFAINEASDNKDGAWEFLQYMIKNADNLMSDNALMSQFPIYVPKLNELIDSASVRQYTLDSDGNAVTDSNGNPIEKSMLSMNEDGDGGVSVSIYALSDKDREELWYILNNIGFVQGSYSSAYEIYMEEIMAFMSKTQNAHQTAEALQDRMTLMLEESK